jgi:concanavalin A-like lectin/glucanase superfamily protein
LPQTTNADASRVLWLKLDEAFGFPTDSSGNAFGVALFGQTTWQPSGGVRGGALKLGGNNAYVQVSDSPLLDNTAAFTLALWFRIDAWSGGRVALAAKAEAGGSANSYSILLDPNSRRMLIDVNTSNDRFSGPLLTTGVWYHVALVYNGALPNAQRVQLWLNGAPEVVAAESSASIPDNGSQLRLGGILGENYYLNGALDDVRFHRRALNPDEIVALAHRYTAPSVFPGPEPIATNQVLTMLNGQSSAPARWSQLSGPANASFDAADPATSIRFIRAGEYVFRLTAEDLLASVCQDLPINVRPNFHVYEDWIARAFPGATDPLVVAEQADPDDDGEPNFIEFGFASDPSQPTPSSFHIERKADGSLWLVHPARLDPARRYDIFVSPDLQTWQDAYPNLSLDIVTRPPDQNEYQILQYRLRETLPGSFFRIGIE